MNFVRIYLATALTAALLSGHPGMAAELELANLFSDHLVLQREREVPVWGWAEPGEAVTVAFGDQRKAATADATGKWRVNLDPMPASAVPRRLTAISSKSPAGSGRGFRNTARNVPFRGHKFDLQQGGVRTPMIVSWPGTIPDGQTFAGLSSSLDIVPTALATAGVDPPTDREIDGVNLLPFLKGEKNGEPHDFLCWQQRQWDRPNQRSPGVNMRTLHQFAIRSGVWKAIRNDQLIADPKARRRPWELYDLSRDPGELQDVATEYPEITERLAAQFEDWQSRMHPIIQTSSANPKK